MSSGFAAELEAAAGWQSILDRCQFPDSGTPVTCAVSGGADSSALLILAIAAGCEATAVHVDHGLRDESAAEADIVRTLAVRVGAAFRAESAPVEPGPNLEARARDARYAVLPANALTGHTADDQAETMVLNLLRGAGPTGMAGMRADGRRPLLGIRRADTEAICRQFNVEPVADSMNTDPQYRRVRVREELLPLMDAIAERDVRGVLAHQAAVFAAEDDLLEALAADLDPTDAKAVAAAPEPLARRAIRRFLQQGPAATHPPDQATVERVRDVAAGHSIGTEVGRGWSVRRTEQRLRLVAPADSNARSDPGRYDQAPHG